MDDGGKRNIVYKIFGVHFVDVSQLITIQIFIYIYFAQPRQHQEDTDLYNLKTIFAYLYTLVRARVGGCTRKKDNGQIGRGDVNVKEELGLVESFQMFLEKQCLSK